MKAFDNMAEMVELIGPQASLIEFGSGSSLKTRAPARRTWIEQAVYVPVDISHEHLHNAAGKAIAAEFPEHRSTAGNAADFTQQFKLPNPQDRCRCRNIVYFPGSTIGNFSPDGRTRPP